MPNRGRTGRSWTREGGGGIDQDRQFTADEVEFMMAVAAYKRETGRLHPEWREVLTVAKKLGYRKMTPHDFDRLEAKVAYLTNVIRDMRAAAFGWDASTLTRVEWDSETDRLIAGPSPVISEVPPKG